MPPRRQVRVVLSQLRRRSGDLVDFVRAKLGRPMLGARRVPRVEVWMPRELVSGLTLTLSLSLSLSLALPLPLTKAWMPGELVSGAPHPSPKSVLLEYRTQWPDRAELQPALSVRAVAPTESSPSSSPSPSPSSSH